MTKSGDPGRPLGGGRPEPPVSCRRFARRISGPRAHQDPRNPPRTATLRLGVRTPSFSAEKGARGSQRKGHNTRNNPFQPQVSVPASPDRIAPHPRLSRQPVYYVPARPSALPACYSFSRASFIFSFFSFQSWTLERDCLRTSHFAARKRKVCLGVA